MVESSRWLKGPYLRQSFGHALAGLRQGWSTEPNLRLHSLATFVALTLGVWLGLAPLEWAVLALTIGLVVSLELVNTALEAVVDLCSPGRHELARRAKDVAAAAVLVAALAALAVGLALFGPKLVALLGR